MKRLFPLAGVLFVSFVCCLNGTAFGGEAAPDEAASEKSRYESLLSQYVSGDAEPAYLSEEASPEDFDRDVDREIDAQFEDDVPDENAIDDLMKALLNPSLPVFDGKPYGLEGRHFIVQEIDGNLRPGEIDRVRLVALRKVDGIYDRALLLEIAPPDGPPFLISLPADLRGYESKIDLKSFTAPDRSEIVLTVRTGSDEGVGRFLVIDGWDKRILYDSKNTKLPAMRGKFFNGYRAEIIVTGNDANESNSHVLIDLSPRKSLYVRNRIYHEGTGHLRSNITIRSVGHLLLEPTDIDNDGVLELKGVADLRGAGRSDRIAYLDFTLRYHDGKWRLIDCWIAPAEDLKLMPLPRKVS
ncbi:MAG: hypothetical protein LBT15_02335 [Synergistaceae bacterium]|jgi:hypothetical protein|nr:hypothetical protein [Synergistaceae bacterium]